MSEQNDTIVAIATPSGRGGIGVIRLSGPQSFDIAKTITQTELVNRYAHYLSFHDQDGNLLDQGIVLYFKSPNSFTGEDVVELQAHGGPIVLDMIMQQVLANGARMARPGEFSERAFLNDKIDLAQAEAIADLINASSQQAAKSALRSITGAFSKNINDLVERLISLRLYVEAAIDFPDEEIDFLSDGKIVGQLNDLLNDIQTTLRSAQQGSLLREGITVVIAGRPNAGKSSLLNALIGSSSAIVTDIPGTTRDLLKEYIQIEGLPLHIIDTAGLRPSSDQVERIGIERAQKEISTADRLLLVMDSNDEQLQETFDDLIRELQESILSLPPITVLLNKQDLAENTLQTYDNEIDIIPISAKHNLGIDDLKKHLLKVIGYHTQPEGVFIARRRHLEAIEQSLNHCAEGKKQLITYHAGELLAEELRLAQTHLSEITGEFSADDLLGRIFSSFCIGK